MFGSPLLRAPVLATVLSGFLACGVQALPKITRTGKYLYDESGTRFYIKGVAYQEQGAVVESADNAFGEPSSFIDPLSVGDACKRDVSFLKDLGINTIRVYSVNSSLNHDDCMSTFSQAGIYTLIDLSLPLNGSIDRNQPAWGTNVLDQYTRTIDVFSKYDNVLGYNIGNEAVVGDHPTTAPFVKAAARDIKSYLSSKKITALIGYAAINGAADFRVPLANFLSCDPSGANSDSSSIDMYGLNNYEWCGDSTFAAAYQGTTQAFSNYNVVAYFGEFGCVPPSPPRPWTEVKELFSSDMAPVWSGGIAFSYFPASSAAGQFGMVTISSDSKTVTTGQDYDNLKSQYGAVSFINSPSQSSVSASSYPTCPTTINSVAVSTKLPPTPNEAACNCLESALSCQFTPKTSNYSTIVGEIIPFGCGLVGQAGGSCDEISGDGGNGTYGRVSYCDPAIKASYVMSLYYEATNKNAQSCSFAGNGTVNSKVPTSVPNAAAAASSCVASPDAVFVPSSAPSSTGKGSSSSGGSSASGKPSAGLSLTEGPHALVAVGMAAMVSLLGAAWTLA
ncbi:glycoside hydrolase family 72 protein [Crepidotus variabilis]|uniref:1,3-beta-glucanosyltransferase n=1 Tax=Crepidotus variabilis TaxID=179855 RepID=A0A9P6EUQ9_9AGAR|nr:glycoside hydrolase family 72 protein [Crepidotus variabilis]